MTVDDATLLAYADGMLPAHEARSVAKAIAGDRSATEKLRLMRDSARLVRDAHAHAFTAPVPEGLSLLLRPAGAAPRRSPPWSPWRRRAAAFAACAGALAIGIVAGREMVEPPGVVSLASAGEASALDDMTAFALIVALDGDAPATGATGPQVTILGDVDAGLGVPCRRFAVAGPAPVQGLACEGTDGTWSLLLLPRSPS